MNDTHEKTRPKVSGAGYAARKIAELERDPEFVAELLALTVVEQIHELMEKQGVNRSQLAERMGVSRAYVTKLFGSPPNMTLQSIAQLALALGLKPEVKLVAVGEHDPVTVSP